MHAHTHTTRGILSRDLRLQRRWFATRGSSDGGVRLVEAAIQKVSSGHNLGSNPSDLVFEFYTNADETLETPKENSGKLESNSDLVDTSGASDDTHETLQVIRKEHARLCNEVKGMSADSLLGSEAVTALQNLSTEYKLLKSKYHEECELLKKKYLEECSERKKLYNEVIELKGNIRVFCRCRPLKQCGLLRNCRHVRQDNETYG
ncbi:hypothetical protein OROGR_019766 [Orobanche gracilis]